MSKFKVGLTKTVSGEDVVIFEVSDKIYIKIKIGSEWSSGERDLDGRSKHLKGSNLLPNVEPLRHEFHTRVLMDYHYSSSKVFLEIPLNFNTKKVHVVITEVFE